VLIVGDHTFHIEGEKNMKWADIVKSLGYTPKLYWGEISGKKCPCCGGNVHLVSCKEKGKLQICFTDNSKPIVDSRGFMVGSDTTIENESCGYCISNIIAL